MKGIAIAQEESRQKVSEMREIVKNATEIKIGVKKEIKSVMEEIEEKTEN